MIFEKSSQLATVKKKKRNANATCFQLEAKKRALECQCKVFFHGISAENCFFVAICSGKFAGSDLCCFARLGKIGVPAG